MAKSGIEHRFSMTAFKRLVHCSLWFYFLLFCNVSFSSEKEYPEHWPAPIVHENGGCVNLSGDYQYHGQLDASSPGTFHSNIDLIVFGQKPAAREPEYVKVFHQQESGGCNMNSFMPMALPLSERNLNTN